MHELSQTVADGFSHYFQDFRQRVHAMASDLTDEQFWSKPFPFGNSFGNLVLHLTGNLNYYIGTCIEDTGYIRDRPREFADVVDGSREQTLAEFEQAVAMVLSSLERQGVADWSLAYQAAGVDDVPNRFQMFLRCCVHFHHHIGQMTYIVKQWKVKP